VSRYSVRDFGARGDGVQLDTRAIQAAIDACHGDGGGTVVLPAGATFRSGTITLRSHVELHLERGAVLQGSADWADYTVRLPVGALSGGILTGDSVPAGMLVDAFDADDIAITGPGVIDGGGRFFVTAAGARIHTMARERPFTVFLRRCRDVDISGVILRDGALWTLRLSGCEDVRITGVRIRNDLRLPNSDGIDLDRCRRVRISDCDIVSGDDAISLKTCEEFGEDGPCEDVVVTNCTLQSTSSAVVIGIDAVAPIRNVSVTNCVIRSSNRGLSVNLGQQGDFENLLFAHVISDTRRFDDGWWGHGEPIYIAVRAWHDVVGRLRNVRFHDILATAENGVLVFAERPGLIAGVEFSDVRLALGRRTGWPGNNQDLRPSATLGIRDHPTAAFYLENADGVTLRDCEVHWAVPDPREYRHVLEAHAVTDLELRGLRGRSADPDRWPALLLDRTVPRPT
jgi:hypothetical protein